MVDFFINEKLLSNELLYSYLARKCAHSGIIGHKLFLEEIFGNRLIVANVDLPSHITQLCRQLGWQLSTNSETLIARHTLYSMYAPFIGKERADKLFCVMKGESGVGIHTQVGAVASIVQPPRYLRYCPHCIIKMKHECGEYYWSRLPQITGAEVCPEHLCYFVSSTQLFRSLGRHHFAIATPKNCPHTEPIQCSDGKLTKLSSQIKSLLDTENLPSPTLWQWTHFYHDLAKLKGFTQGRRTTHEDIAHLFLSYWDLEFLQKVNLHKLECEHSWLINIFRKHKKAFNYLQHMMVWQAFDVADDPKSCLEKANQYPKEKLPRMQLYKLKVSVEEVEAHRSIWIRLQKQHPDIGVKRLRHTEQGRRTYAWLYRHDRDWFVEHNKPFHRSTANVQRVDWQSRDLESVRLLLKVYHKAVKDIRHRHLTRNWLLKQLPHSSSIEHHLHELPLCKAFFDRYVESLAEYQIRRITAQCAEAYTKNIVYKRWELERICGLSKERSTELTNKFLDWVVTKGYEQIYLQKNS
jgi:hypothetical protein